MKSSQSPSGTSTVLPVTKTNYRWFLVPALILALFPPVLVFIAPNPIYAAFYKTLGGALLYSVAFLFALILVFFTQLSYFQNQRRNILPIGLLIIPGWIFMAAPIIAQLSSVAAH